MKKKDYEKWFNKERTLLSNERTLLSYIRTSLAAFVFGFALIQLSSSNEALSKIGTASIITGFILLIIGIIEFSLHKKRINNKK